MIKLKPHLNTHRDRLSSKGYFHLLPAVALFFMTTGIHVQAIAATPEVGFTQLDLPKGVSALNPQMCINGYNLALSYNPIAGISGSYGSEQILYNAMMMNPRNRPTSTAIITNSTSEIARLIPYSTQFNYTASDVFWGVTHTSDNFQHAIGSLDLFGAQNPKDKCRGAWISFVDLFERYQFPLAHYWDIGAGQPTGATKLYCPPKQFRDKDKGYFYEYCVPYAVSDDGLKVYGYEYTASAFVIWERSALNQPFSSYNIPYPFQGAPYILGASKDNSQVLYRAINSNDQPSTFLLTLGNSPSDYSISELSLIPNTYGFDSDKSTVVAEWAGDIIKLPLSEVHTGNRSELLSFNTFSDFENQDWQIMPVQNLAAEALAGFPVKRRSDHVPAKSIDSVIWRPYYSWLKPGKLVNALDYWQNQCHIKGIENWTLDNHLNSVFYAKKQSNGLVSYYGYYRRTDNPEQEPALYRITVDHALCVQ